MGGGLVVEETLLQNPYLGWWIFGTGCLVIILAFIVEMVLYFKYRAPRIIFGQPRIAIEDVNMVWYIGVANIRLEGWRMRHCKRNTAFNSKVDVRFAIEGENILFANAIWWDSEDGEDLLPDSKFHEFPLVIAEVIEKSHEDEVISLAGTQASTASPIPPMRMAHNIKVIANVSVTSPYFKNAAISTWRIVIKPSYFSPASVERVH
jgi:hypothetical protein